MCHIYLAGPFFNPVQSKVISQIEEIFDNYGARNIIHRSDAILASSLSYFSPRRGHYSTLMNEILERRETPPPELQDEVFADNHQHIRHADLMLAVIDDRDTGTMWEMGYAYAVGTPTLTYTNHDYGMNLMLARSIIGHLKGLADLDHVMQILKNDSDLSETGSSLLTLKNTFLTDGQLFEGPKEHNK